MNKQLLLGVLVVAVLLQCAQGVPHGERPLIEINGRLFGCADTLGRGDGYGSSSDDSSDDFSDSWSNECLDD
ncbi:Hypothetical predicted protein [Mytilus galloprovincialis]|uniref:Secreted protein n=1 Tax=Mytilus galloprovincialis TaxID=29158 RepID=A0A8B6CPG7_MYTGA|nr:Hypothetical predicted protein [Mytilus galloprovincialis]